MEINKHHHKAVQLAYLTVCVRRKWICTYKENPVQISSLSVTHSVLKVYFLMPVRADYSCPRSLERLYSESKSEPQTENRFLLCQAKASTLRAISEWQFMKINYILWARERKSEYLNRQG